MNITKIYDKYFLPEHLQLHMLRVTACANLIMDNWIGEKLNKEAVTRVLLLHDMGNMAKIPEKEITDINLLKIRKVFTEKYGENDHEINLEIARIEGLNSKEIELLNGKRSRKNEETLKDNSYERKICAYCDQRVSPNGVTSIQERLEDAKIRYKDRPLSVWSNEEKANHLIDCSLGIEKQIMKYCSIKPKEINDITIQPYIEKLREYQIIKKN